MEPARIQFENLNGFPAENRLKTGAFLIASNEIVGIIETFGKLFTPVVNDMLGNIAKLRKVYKADNIKFQYLDDLIELNNVHNNYAADALLWLKRGLQLICTFFENILHDATREESLKLHLKDAYERTLKPHHNFIVQQTIKIIYKWGPTRSQLIGSGIEQDKNLKLLAIYLSRMRQHLLNIDALLEKHLHLNVQLR